MFIWQKSLQLAGKAVVQDNVITLCQVDTHGTGLLLSLKRVFDILQEHNDLVHDKFPVLKSSLLLTELWIDDWFSTDMDKPLEDPVGNTKQRYWAIVLRVLLRLLKFWDHDYQRSAPDFENFESVQAGRKEAA